MVKYQFEIDSEEWQEWKQTVPRTKTLDERIRELIRADTEGNVGSDRAPPVSEERDREAFAEPRDEENPVEPGGGAVEDVDPITEALKGWSYGRTDEEQAASRAVARASLEWLRDDGGVEVQQEDVPLDELKEEDPEDRKPDTLWRSVIRGAWQHAAGQGYVERPHSRAYRWGGQPDGGE